jgi:squamous cell carcinoma antigen recognized by T-cells 3
VFLTKLSTFDDSMGYQLIVSAIVLYLIILLFDQVTPRLKELMTFKSQEEAKVEAYPNLNDNSNANDSSQKRKPSNNKQQPPAKKRKENPPKSTMPSDDQGSNVQSGHSGAVTDVEVGGASREKVMASIEMKVDSDSRTGKSSSNEPKPSFYNDNFLFLRCTYLLKFNKTNSPLSLQANEDDLRRFFSDIGGATAIRLLRDRFTKKSRVYVTLNSSFFFLFASSVP